MKKIAGLLVAALVVFAFVACQTTKPEKTGAQTAKVPPYTIISNQNSDFGGSVPAWVTKSVNDLESSDPSYKDFYVFKFEGTGTNLEGTKLKVNNLNAAGEIARYISLRVQALFSGAQVGDDKNLETYMENVVKSLAQVNVSGFRKLDDFWVQRQYNDTGKEEYVYRVLYTIPKATVKQLMSTANDKAADTPEKETAKERVQRIMEGNLPSLIDDPADQ